MGTMLLYTKFSRKLNTDKDNLNITGFHEEFLIRMKMSVKKTSLVNTWRIDIVRYRQI